MRILPIKSYNTTFKSNLGFDEDVSQIRRDIIREHLFENAMKYQDIYEKQGRMEEYAINNVLKKLVQTQSANKIEFDTIVENGAESVDHKVIKALPIHNIERLPYEGINNSYRGEALFNRPELLKALKDAGIKRIVDIAGYDGYKELCAKNGLEYTNFFVGNDFYFKDPFKTEEEVVESCNRLSIAFGLTEEKTISERNKRVKTWEKNINKLVKNMARYFNAMQQDYVYIGCSYGTYRTDSALMINHLFNPKFQNGPNYITWENKYDLSYLETFYHNLTAKHKEILGWTEEFDATILPKITKYKKLHNIH